MGRKDRRTEQREARNPLCIRRQQPLECPLQQQSKFGSRPNLFRSALLGPDDREWASICSWQSQAVCVWTDCEFKWATAQRGSLGKCESRQPNCNCFYICFVSRQRTNRFVLDRLW